MVHRLSPVTYELTLSEGEGVHWEVVRVHVDEGLNRPYRAIVEAQTEAEEPDTDVLLGSDACLSLTRGAEGGRVVFGLVSRIVYVGTHHHRLVVRFTLEPALELLRQRIHSRIFQQLAVLDIVREVLEPALASYGRDLDVGSVSRARVPRDYCVQYRESDFAFVSRLLEEEGISYTFIHDPDSGVERLALRDQNDQYGTLANVDGTAEIPLIPTSPSEADIESIQQLEWTKQLTSTAALRRDYDWHTPRRLLSATAPGVDERQHERRIYAHGTRRWIDDDLDDLVADTRDAELARSRVVRGRANVSGMCPGLRFTVRGHGHHDFEQEYLLTEVVHTGAEAPVASSGEALGEPHSVEFEGIPFDAPLRPRTSTPQPREYGPQTAIVTGPPGEEIHTDEHGRVQVQFYWEETPSYTVNSSCWVRCSQSWAGMCWGAQFIPRVGMEVVIEFLEGNPDRPLVTGCVYNGAFPPPFPLPENKTQSGWRTESSPGGGGNNELRFEDAAGNEEIYLHGEKNWTIRIEHDKDQRVDHDERLVVRNDRRKEVGHDERVEIGHDRSEVIDHDHNLHVANDQLLKVDRDQDATIGRNRSHEVKEADRLEVGATMELTVGKSLTARIEDKAEVEIGKDYTVRVGGDASETVSGDKVVESHAAETRTADDMSFESGKKFMLAAEDDIEVEGDAELRIKAAKKITFECGDASLTLSKDGKIKLEGKDITIKGSGNVVIKGQKVAEN